MEGEGSTITTNYSDEIFLGREKELGQLVNSYGRLREQKQKQGGTDNTYEYCNIVELVLIAGHSGVGKTRLVKAFSHQISHQYPEDKVFFLRGKSDEGSSSRPAACFWRHFQIG